MPDLVCETCPMSLDFLITLALTIAILAVAAGMTARNRRARPAVFGLGLALIPVGLYLAGLTTLIINGVQSIVDWLQRTVWTDVITWGLGLLVAGVVLMVVARFLPREPKPRPAPTAVPGGQAPREVPGRPAATGATAATAAPTTAAAKPTAAPASKQTKGLDDEDAEIEALLRKRGIM